MGLTSRQEEETHRVIVMFTLHAGTEAYLHIDEAVPSHKAQHSVPQIPLS